MNYGYQFKIRTHGIYLMINGRMFSFHKSATSGKWRFVVWDNIWRKRGEAVPCKS